MALTVGSQHALAVWPDHHIRSNALQSCSPGEAEVRKWMSKQDIRYWRKHLGVRISILTKSSLPH